MFFNSNDGRKRRSTPQPTGGGVVPRATDEGLPLAVGFPDTARFIPFNVSDRVGQAPQEADGNVTVTPDVIALALATLAPVVTATDHQLVTPDTATLTTATFAPTVTASDNKTVVPDTVALVTTAFAPTVTVADNRVVTPDTAALVTSAFAPDVTITANQTVTPDTAALVLTTFEPTVTGGQGLTITPDTAALTLTAFAPDVTATGAEVAGDGQPPPAGAPARDTRQGRRRYIMPDGRMFMATTDEVLQLLQLYAAPKESIAELTEAPKAQPVIRAPRITLQKRDVRFVPDEDQPNTYRAVIAERFVYRAPADAYGQAEILANRIRADEEAILALLL